MGLGRLFNTRSTVLTATDTKTGVSQTFTITDNMAPDWAAADAYRGGMSIPGASRAVTLISDLLGQFPWDGYRKFVGKPEEKMEPRPLMLEQPHPPYSRMTTISSWAMDLIWHGNAVGIVADRNAAGTPTAFIPVGACYVGVRRVTPYMDSPLPIGALEYRVGNMSFGPEDILHILGPCEPGALRGRGVLELHFNTLDLAKAQQDMARTVARNHGMPTGVITSDDPNLNDTESARIKSEWISAQNTVAVLNNMTHFTPLSWDPDKLQLVQARQMTYNDLENVFGLPIGWLGGMNSARQYSNIEQDAINLLRFTLGGHLGRFEQGFSLKLPRGQEARANLDAILRADTLTRFQAYAIGIKNEFLSTDEAREAEHRPPLPKKPVPPPLAPFQPGQPGQPGQQPEDMPMNGNGNGRMATMNGERR